MTKPPHQARDAALHTIRKLRAAGHTALLAGGCVRDRLLGIEPKDYDVATDAVPDRVAEIFPRARKVGAKFGVVLVRRFGCDVEVATFRIDGDYADGRHPDEVTFGTAEDDARRRDFTINGLFCDPVDDRVIDYVGGREDLAAGIIRTIGEPDRRFGEDHLRMLRAVRFAARLGFSIDPGTRDAIGRLADRLAAISVERIWMELELMLADPTRATAWRLLVDLGLRGHLSSVWAGATLRETAAEDLIQARLAALPSRALDAAVGLAATLCDGTPRHAVDVARALRLSNRTRDAVVWLVKSLPAAYASATLDLADLKLLMANPSWADLPDLLRADLAAHGADPSAHAELLRRAGEIAPDSVAPPPLVTGDDLSAEGLAPGPQMGAILRRLYRAQLNGETTHREAALRLARRWLGEETA